MHTDRLCFRSPPPPQPFPLKPMEIRWQTGKVAMVPWLQGFDSSQEKLQSPLPQPSNVGFSFSFKFLF